MISQIPGQPATRTTPADLRALADEIEHLAPAWATRCRREATRMQLADGADHDGLEMPDLDSSVHMDGDVG